MKTQTSLHAVLICILAALIAGCAGLAPSGRQALAGTWTNSSGTIWTIKADGTFSADLNQDGKADVWGTYTLAGEAMTLHDVSKKIPKPCRVDATYRFARKGDTLHFTLVKDPCKLRKENILLDWHKKK